MWNKPLILPIIFVILGILTYLRIIYFPLFVAIIMTLFLLLLYNLNKGTRDFDD
jgi:hypothetical protein